jgi:hypothetical protein
MFMIGLQHSRPVRVWANAKVEVAVIRLLAIIRSQTRERFAKFMTEWNIQSRAQGCETCSRHFADQEAYHTLLFDEKAGLRRSDVCAACWEKQFAGGHDRKGFVSYWQGVYQAPPPPADPIKRETAETLLRKLIELNDPQYIPAAYILAVTLERKRLLKIKEQMVREGQRVFIYEQPATGDVFTILDPNLRLDLLDQVQRDVGGLLEHGLNPPAPVPAPAESQAVSEDTIPAWGPEQAPLQPEAASKMD